MQGYFIGRLEVTPIPVGLFARTKWELTKPLWYHSESGDEYKIPQCFKTDLASIPWFLYPIMKPSGAFGITYARAAVLHDYLLTQDMPSSKAHSLFKEALLVCGASKTLANIMYHAVNRPKASEIEEPEDITQGEDDGIKILND